MTATVTLTPSETRRGRGQVWRHVAMAIAILLTSIVGAIPAGARLPRTWQVRRPAAGGHDPDHGGDCAARGAVGRLLHRRVRRGPDVPLRRRQSGSVWLIGLAETAIALVLGGRVRVAVQPPRPSQPTPDPGLDRPAGAGGIITAVLIPFGTLLAAMAGGRWATATTTRPTARLSGERNRAFPGASASTARSGYPISSPIRDRRLNGGAAVAEDELYDRVPPYLSSTPPKRAFGAKTSSTRPRERAEPDFAGLARRLPLGVVPRCWRSRPAGPGVGPASGGSATQLLDTVNVTDLSARY